MFFVEKLFRAKEKHIKYKKMPEHIAIIMDGNGRWAEKRGMPRTMGHREGSNNIRRIVNYCSSLGIKYLTVYAFSTENWNRPKSEVDTLMSLLEEYLKKADKELKDKNVRIRIIGSMDRLSPSIRNEIKRVIKSTEKNTGLNFIIAFNYGGRDEILHAAQSVAKDVRDGKISVESIDKDTFEKYLYTEGIPDPDLLIRTSGELRISNFLLWQLAYTEMWFTDVLWPDFREKHIDEAIESYQNRNRRYGGV